ncbi:MAG TPA: FAD-binding oxidoreductase [Castellaniella sp.]|uniref:NAD(P)/FAD-dependent oxidoreductase n=1 Tax=Castellaniella sp. TaxID=1955812 RepID=UPI002F1B7A1C
MATTSCQVAVIGGGIIGASCALYLQEAGLDVMLIEREDIASGASQGNAGGLAFAEILPLASPRIIRKALHWMRDPLGPLSLPPAYLPQIAPWLLRLWRASWPDRYRANIQSQVSLIQLAQTELLSMMARTGLDRHLHTEGVLEVYEGAERFATAQEVTRQRAHYGIQSQVLQGAALAEFQPGLSARFTHGIYLDSWRNIDDPYRYTQDVARHALSQGTRQLRGKVVHLSPTPSGGRIHLADGTLVEAQHVVVAAGAWSHQLTRPLGDVIPLETERGYNTTLAPDALDLHRQITFPDHGFVVSPLTCGIRVGGAVELAGLKRAPDYRRSTVMLDKAKAFLPALRTENGHAWMGFRPSLPDSLPVIGPARRHLAFIYAFGHGHLGLTQSAATARLVRDMVTGQTPAIPLHPYRPGRFSLFKDSP